MRGAGHRDMMHVRLAGSWARQKSTHPFPRLAGTTGSIELGIFDESERGRTEVSRAGSRVRTARQSWPLSARLLVGAMFVLNTLLAAFFVRTEIKRTLAPATSTPLTLERPKAGSSPQLNAPANQGSSLGVNTPPVEARPVTLPSTQMAKGPATKALRVSKSLRPVLSAPIPRAVVYPLQQPLGQTPAPVRDPAASSGTSANVAPPGRAAPFGNPGAGVPGNATPPPNAPAASALAPSAIGHSLTARGTRSGSMNKVASVGLPSMEKGLVTPKMPAAPISPKIEIIPRPAVKLENCGDDHVFIACPTLKTRYDTPFTSEDH
jgi:hypothetical protein